MWCIPVVNSPSTPVTAPETIAASLACPRLRSLDRKALRSSNPGRPPMAATTVTAVDGPHPVYTPLHGVRSRLVTICQRYRPPLGRRSPARQGTALTHTCAVPLSPSARPQPHQPLFIPPTHSHSIERNPPWPTASPWITPPSKPAKRRESPSSSTTLTARYCEPQGRAFGSMAWTFRRPLALCCM